jgi:hypothetical protein
MVRNLDEIMPPAGKVSKRRREHYEKCAKDPETMKKLKEASEAIKAIVDKDARSKQAQQDKLNELQQTGSPIEDANSADVADKDDLRCLLCQLDATAEQPKKKYSRLELEKHLAGDYHDRREQISRAFRAKIVGGRITCHLCGESFNHDEIFEHFKGVHPEFRPE